MANQDTPEETNVWIDQLISSGLPSYVEQFLLQNSSILLRVGKDVFVSFLTLMNEKKYEAAFNLLLAKMNADDIIQRMESNAIQLNEATRQREAFLSQIKKLLITGAFRYGSQILLGVLLNKS